MKLILVASILAALFVGCGKNTPGTMGGEPGTPKTVATGAPAQAANGSEVSDPNRSALASERASSTFDDSASTNAHPVTQPDASTRSPNAKQ
jgi:hypothetical protein